ncbi:hypothetical protein NDR87_17930 [Nocardia sp. CDC159]|uniref:Uncharacterized protein n=1 Tax=Nocardia pulmonis TaxID=2951408 RepID=A0A9X2E7L2_9NOCA|nr:MULTISPECIES: hypothetical protein [Nocardia]MCM6775782.1 hypothetical protein [Nocardia pulmonis]MCM6788242.1 hypothetical protein [Nocardia sp. CDC159]
MTGRTIARLAATAAALGIGVAATLGSATAEPAKSPLDTAIERLTTAAGPDPAARAGVESTAKAARLITAVRLEHIAGGFTPFAYQAPTIGCGNGFVTLTAASGVSGEPGPNHGIAGHGPGTLRFQATPAVTGFPIASGLTVAWLNVSNGRSGIDPLDDVSEYKLPGLSRTVETGAGTVVASLWGTVNYPTSLCVVTPTVGMFTVTDDPVPSQDPNAAPAQPVPDASAPGAPGTNSEGKRIIPPGGDTPIN